MKRIISLLIILVSLSSAAQDMSRLFAVGSAVPGGIQELTAFPNKQFKYTGTLYQGTLAIRNQGSIKRYLKPTYEDSYVVNNTLPYTLSSDSAASQWVVPVTEDIYRITVDLNAKTLHGELFTAWNELFIVGGATECGWVTYTFLPFTRDPEEVCAWDWTGELKERPEYGEPRRFKFNGQNAWEPKVLHPFTSDEDVLKSTQILTGGTIDHKWSITKEGYYHIRVDVFRETVKAEYLGASLPGEGNATGLDDFSAQPVLSIRDREVLLQSNQPVQLTISSLAGVLVTSAKGTDIRTFLPSSGIYLIRIQAPGISVSRKIVVK
ncbi:MAG: T9SS type A sorting domain-containing protein [Bacteroidaceae bacterium]|nr:T9SS type A sorting domain-containing protein [Bacteroidaceae bacterium]